MSEKVLLKQLVAKSGDEGRKWLPLYMHLEDTAGIMRHLVDEYIPKSFCCSCGIEQKLFLKTAVFLAYIHDIGKSIISFQYKILKSVPDRRSILEHCGLVFPDYYDKEKIAGTPHALAGEVILRFFGCPGGVAAVVGAHHGMPTATGDLNGQNLNNSQRDMVGYRNYFGDTPGNREILEPVWKEIINQALKRANLSSVEELPELSRGAQMLYSALLIMADWIASNTEFFPLLDVEKDEPDNNPYPQRIEQGWEKAGFTEMWQSCRNTYSETAFKQSFGFSPSTVQKEILHILENTDNPGLCIIEAPMGCGKTEAALASAEILAAKLDKNGIFFGLPSQATANGIFPRIIGWAEKQSEEIYHSVQLNHGSAELNDVFGNIHRGIPDEETDSGLIVNSWFCDRKKACLADFVTATVDQMLMMALKRKHVMLLHLGLAEKVVIIDEVHAYDAYMSRYLERALQWLGAYHTPVILLSATLPASKRVSLCKAYLGLNKIDDDIESNIAYPLLTLTEGQTVRQFALPYNGAHKTVEIKTCCTDDIFELVRNVVDNGGCVGVIVNTVKRSQNVAERIELETDAQVLLYHAQFIIPDRAKKEEELLSRIGKKSRTEQRKGLAVVGTQVLEQSLDIDFDLLITDICPMDLLLQRIGRLHRHNRTDRPRLVEKAVCYVITDEVEGAGTKEIYGEWLLEETLKYLPSSITLPDDISPLVQTVYKASDNSREFEEYKNNQDIKRGKASAFLLNKPKGKDIHGLLDCNVKDSLAEASVRDGLASVEVLVMRKFVDNSIHFLPHRFDGAKVSENPSEEECRRIAEQKLRLPSIFSAKWSVDKTISELESGCMEYIESWQKSYLLKGQLVLFLDEYMEGELLGYTIHYSYEKGLQYEKKGECE